MFNISLEEAQDLIYKNAIAGKSEKISLYKALGRTAYEDIYAPDGLPTSKQAAQDGFAIAEIKGEGGLYKIAGAAECPDYLPKDWALPVETGQKLPDNSEAVVPLEDVEIKGNFIRLKKKVKPYSFIKMPGEDFKKGEKLISRGEVLSPGRISLLAAYGYKEVKVYARPKAAIITLNPYISSPQNTIIDSNSYLLAALVENEGGEVIFIEHAGNKTWPELEKMLERFRKEADIVIATGATFGGKNRELALFMEKAGGKILFSGVRIQPGGHNGAVLFGDLLFLSLSGNPAACAVGFHLLAAPFLRVCQGKPFSLSKIKAKAENSFSLSKKGSRRFLRGYFYFADEPRVKILPGQKPGMIKSLLHYNCLVEIPSDVKEIQPGMVFNLICI
ncbi:molybdopterin molybdotransferase MoeA [Thermosyntropha sp.]|uniref:molybdopterin molybdotransferase MoeA n=1 Tax=Thermosyntropha sp. TaxID=2740820 RepID=UPI0025EA443C|nr:molybdopterin molybdotransferase MoeA [Thermosyntropha sp.]MBO8159592.1 molybdopterin molybdotransferase MoeA [Thermosyntropha sp.]